MPRKAKAKAKTEAEQLAAPEEGKAVQLHTVVTKFKTEVAAPQISAAQSGPGGAAAGDRRDNDRDDVDDDDLDDDDGGDEELDFYDEASAILQEVDEDHPSMVTIYRLPSLRQLGQPGQSTRPAFCGTTELTPDYQLAIQTALGGGSYRLVVRWPSGHPKAGSIRKQWDVQIEPLRLMAIPGAGVASAAPFGAPPPPVYPPAPAPPERKETIADKLREMAEFRTLLIEAGFVPPQPAIAPAAPAEPQTADAHFLKFAMSDETTRAAIIQKYLGGSEKGEGSSEWVELAREYGPLALNLLGGLAQHMAQQPAAPTATAPPVQADPQPNPQPTAPPATPPPGPRQMSVEESTVQFLLNSIQSRNPVADVVQQIQAVEAKHPQLTHHLVAFLNIPPETIIVLLGDRYPAAREMLQQPGVAEYVDELQAELVEPKIVAPVGDEDDMGAGA